jgi:hypothetical protein
MQARRCFVSVVGSLRANPHKLRIVREMAKWLMSPVLKTGLPARLSRDQISLRHSLPCFESQCAALADFTSLPSLGRADLIFANR